MAIFNIIIFNILPLQYFEIDFIFTFSVEFYTFICFHVT